MFRRSGNRKQLAAHNALSFPTEEQLRQVLISQAHNIISFSTAAMHLASPTSAILGPDIYREMGVWYFRGKSVPVAEDLDGAVRTALQLMEMTVVPSDMFIDLTQPKAQWVKIGHSGVRKVASGLPLLGGPTLVSDAQCSDQLIRRVAQAALAGEIPQLNSPFTHGSSTVFIQCEPDLISLVTDANEQYLSPHQDLLTPEHQTAYFANDGFWYCERVGVEGLVAFRLDSSNAQKPRFERVASGLDIIAERGRLLCEVETVFFYWRAAAAMEYTIPGSLRYRLGLFGRVEGLLDHEEPF